MKKVKKAMGVLLCSTMVLAGCGGASDANSSSENSASVDTSSSSTTSETADVSSSAGGNEERLTFEYFTLSMSIEWIQQIYDALVELGEQYNFEVLQGDGDYDINNQLSQVDTALAQAVRLAEGIERVAV